jgi:membrane-anchored glycerophosphoryl diester phosphodiesterase (GDPDase)
MTAQLRPMNLGEILDRTLQIYRSRFLVLFSIAAIPALALMAIKLADNRWFPQSQNRSADQKGMDVLWNLFRSLLHYHFAAIVALLIFPIFAKIASAAILDQATSLRAALRFALSKWRSFLWIAFLKFAAQLLIPEALTFGAILLVGGIEYATGAFDDKGAVILVALALFSPILGGAALFLWLSSCLSLAVPVVALEPFTGFKAMKRSWKLSRDARIRIHVAWMSLSLLAIGLAIGFHMILRGVAVYVFFHGQYSRLADQPLYRFMDYLLTAALSALTSPLYPIALTLFYYDQRVRREAFDIEWMMLRAGLVVPAPPQPETQPLPVSQPSPQPPPMPPQPGALE